MRIDDRTGNLDNGAREELFDFVTNELLSDKLDIHLLDVVIIRNDQRASYLGYWKAAFHYNPDNSNSVVAGAAVIVLNSFYLKTINSLKRTLAHEYGHHWTLSYLAINHSINMNQKLPLDYYQLRLLEPQQHSHDYSMGWGRCDREIIAEDYRVLFAPSPHNRDHKMVANSENGLQFPNLSVRDYIENLAGN